jgi:hypothetical protein
MLSSHVFAGRRDVANGESLRSIVFVRMSEFGMGQYARRYGLRMIAA